MEASGYDDRESAENDATGTSAGAGDETDATTVDAQLDQQKAATMRNKHGQTFATVTNCVCDICSGTSEDLFTLIITQHN